MSVDGLPRKIEYTEKPKNSITTLMGTTNNVEKTELRVGAQNCKKEIKRR